MEVPPPRGRLHHDPVTFPCRAPIRVVIADDHRVLREAFARLLRREADVQVVGEAATGGEALALVRVLRPDVLILDLSLPDMDGLALARQVTTEAGSTRVVVCSMHASGEREGEARRAGAWAYVEKGGPIEDLLSAVRWARAGAEGG